MFKLKKPCVDCPFRNDKPYQKGWLGKTRMEEIYQSLKDGKVFPCHKTTTHDQDEDYDDDDNGGFQLQRHNQFCAGALILLEKTGDADYSQAVQIGERLRMYDRSKMKMDSPVFNTAQELIDWHTR